MGQTSMEEYVSIDKDIPACKHIIDEDIIKDIIDQRAADTMVSSDEEETTTPSTETNVPTY